MKISYMGPGPYIDFEHNGTVFSRGSDFVDCAEHHADAPVILDITMTKDGNLSFGVADPGAVYVANLVLPAREYTYGTQTDPETGEDMEVKTALPLDMSRVQASLWTFNDSSSNENEEAPV